MTKNDKIIIMQEAGKIASFILGECLDTVKPGVSTWEINQVAEKLIKKKGVYPAFKTVRNYPCATCITVNEEIVHGLPKKEKIIKLGDIVTVDLGIRNQDFYVDTAWTILVGNDKKKAFFLKAGKEALDKAIEQCVKGRTVGDISFAIQSSLEKNSLVPEVELIGHGVGKKLHQEPDIPCLSSPLTKGRTGIEIRLEPGMTLAIEVIYKTDKGHLYTKSDDWTMATKNGILTAVFELTVAVGVNKPLIITPKPIVV